MVRARSCTLALARDRQKWHRDGTNMANKVTVRKVRKNGELQWMVDRREGGQRKRTFFPTRFGADAEAANLRIQFRQVGSFQIDLSQAERAEAAAIIPEMTARSVTLRQVWEDWQRGTMPAAGPAVPLSQVVEECLTAKRTANRRDRYVGNLAIFLRSFATGREAQSIAAIGAADVEAWINGRYRKPSSRQTALNRISTLFSFAVRRGYRPDNPCDRVERITVDAGIPKILSLAQCARLLVTIRNEKPQTLAWFVLGLFAGVRPEEADRLTWSAIDLDHGTITVDAAAAKTRDRRIIHLEPAAVAWLRCAADAGAVLPMPRSNRRKAQRALRPVLGFQDWPKDVLRHTCASMLMASWRDAGKVAAELGHSPGILFRHYRELVRRPDAARFWSLTPEMVNAAPIPAAMAA
jgi:integrase